MRILFINTLYPPNVGGGAEITLSTLVNGLTLRGHETAVLTTQGGKGLTVTNENGSTVYRSSIRNIYWHFSTLTPPSWQRFIWHAIDSYNPFAGHDIKQVVNKFKPDIISCHNLPGFSVAAWNVAAKAGIPTIQVLHDYYTICPKTTVFKNGSNCLKPCTSCAMLRLPHKHLSNKVSAVVGVSQAVLDKHLQAGLFTDTPIKKVIYNRRSLKSSQVPRQKQDVLTFGFIGSLTPVKGVAQLLETFTRIADQTPHKLQLLIGGSGKDDYVKDLKQRYGSDKRIVFLGHVNPSDFFSQVDITVVPSIWNEPLGMVVPESLGFHVPVIGSKRGGIPEMIQHEKNGLIYDPDEPYALDKAMLRLIENPDLLAAMQKAAAPSAARFLNQEDMITEHQMLYKEILSDHNS